MKSIYKVLCLGLALIWPLALVAQETIRITNGEWPPYLSKDLKHYGVASRIVTEAFAREGIQVEYGFFPWARAYALAKEGEWEGSAVWVKNAEREELFYLSDSIMETGYAFFYLKNQPFDWKTLEDLKNVRIGGALKYDYGEEFTLAEKEGRLLVERVPKEEQNLAKLLEGRIQITPIDPEVGYSMLAKNFKPEEAAKIAVHPHFLRTQGMHLLLSKKHPKNQALIARFNQGLKHLRESGKWQQFIEEGRRL